MSDNSTHFFKKNKDILDIFTDKSESIKKAYFKNIDNFQILNLKDFEEDQIIEFLKKRTSDWKIIYKKIQNIYDLEDLAKRPLLLNMIIRTVPKLSDDKINSKRLYDIYTEDWLMHDSFHGDKRAKIKSEQRTFFMEELAFLMYQNNETQTMYCDELYEHIRKLEKLEPTGIDLAQVDEEVRNCSFLNRDKNGNFRFIHKSFMEYFYAKKLAKEIRMQDYENLRAKQLSYEILDFLKDFEEFDEYNEKKLIQAIKSTKGRDIEDSGYLGGNIASILNIRKYNFEGENFSDCILTGAYFAEANLKNVSFRNAYLTSINFNRCDLTNADLRNAICDLMTVEEGKEIRSCTFSADGKYIAFGLWNGMIKVIKADSFKDYLLMGAHSNSVTCIAVSKDGKYLVSGGYDYRIKLWDLLKGKELFTYLGHESLVRAIEFDATNKKIISANKNGDIILCTITENNSIVTSWKIKLKTGPIRCLAYHPNEPYIAVGEYDGGITFLDERDGLKYSRIKAHEEGAVWGLSFTKDGNRLATCGWDKTIRLWDIKTNKDIKQLYKSVTPIRCVAFNLSGNLLAAGDNKGGLFLVDVDSSNKILDFEGHEDTVYTVQFDPVADDRLISSALDGSVKMWDVNSGKLINSTPTIGERFKCQGMKINGAKITEDDIDYLVQRGAII